MEFLRKGILTKRQTINGQGQELVMTELNPAHPLVQEALPNYRQQYEEEAARARLGLPDDEELDEDESYADQYDDDEYDGDEEELESETDVVLPGLGVAAAGSEDDEFEPDIDLEDDNRGNLIQPESSRFSRTATRTRPR